MSKAFTEILPCGILPALSQHISRASEMGNFESQYCLGCPPRDIPEMFNSQDFHELSEILTMCTGQKFFPTLSTRIVESTLLAMPRDSLTIPGYVFLSLTFGSV